MYLYLRYISEVSSPTLCTDLHDDLDEVFLPELLPRAGHEVRVHLDDPQRRHAVGGQGAAGGRGRQEAAHPGAADRAGSAVSPVVVDVGRPVCVIRGKIIELSSHLNCLFPPCTMDSSFVSRFRVPARE